MGMGGVERGGKQAGNLVFAIGDLKGFPGWSVRPRLIARCLSQGPTVHQCEVAHIAPTHLNCVATIVRSDALVVDDKRREQIVTCYATLDDRAQQNSDYRDEKAQ